MTANETLRTLVGQAEAASARMSVRNPNRALLLRLCAFSMAMAQRCVELEKHIVHDDEPRIVIP